MTWQAYQPAALLIGIPLAVAFFASFYKHTFRKKEVCSDLCGRRPCIVPITIWISCSVAKSDR